MMPFCDLRPHLASPFSPRATPNGILLFSFAFPVCRVPFRPSQPERNFIFNTAYPPSARHFHPRKAPKRILFLTLHSQSAATFFTLEKHQREFYYFSLHSPSAAPFLSPCSPERNFILSLYIHPPSAAARGSRAALQYFRSYRPPFTTRGTGSPYMPNTSNDRARNALHSAETEKFSRPQTLRPPHIGAQGRPYKMNTRKNRIHRRGGRRGIIGRRKWRQGIYYTGIIGRERSSRSIIHGFSASEGVAGI